MSEFGRLPYYIILFFYLLVAIYFVIKLELKDRRKKKK